MKSKTIRKIGPISTLAILPLPTPSRNCSPAGNGTSESRVTNPFSIALLAKEDHAPVRRSASDEGESLAGPSHESSIPQQAGDSPPTPVPQARRKLSRNGKIARLAKPLRDMVNLMLQNNIQHSMIAEALEEHGVRVTKRNISNWKTRGGYDDWRFEQERILTTRLRQDNLTDYLRTSDATHLPEVGLQLTATQLCEFLLNPQTQQQLTSEPEKFARTISNLCRVTRHLHLLQKYRDDSARELGYKHNPERVKRETDKRLETTRHIYSAEKLGETADEPDIPHRNFIPKNPSAYMAQDDSDPDIAGPPVDPIRALSNLTSLLKEQASAKPTPSV